MTKKQPKRAYYVEQYLHWKVLVERHTNHILTTGYDIRVQELGLAYQELARKLETIQAADARQS